MKKIVLMFLVVILALGFPTSVLARAGGGGHMGSGSNYRSSGHVNSGYHGHITSSPGHVGGVSRGNSGTIHSGRHVGNGYHYRGWVPRGAIVGSFVGGVVIGGVLNHFWWPYYAVSVSPSYYSPYYPYPYVAPSYVIAVPPAEATTAYSQSDSEAPAATSPTQCYAPKTDDSGNVMKDGSGNMIPDFSKPVPCPSQEN